LLYYITPPGGRQRRIRQGAKEIHLPEEGNREGEVKRVRITHLQHSKPGAQQWHLSKETNSWVDCTTNSRGTHHHQSRSQNDLMGGRVVRSGMYIPKGTRLNSGKEEGATGALG